ncbi:MAG: TonB-dependent receptor [Chitinispirillaceae bacterium]|nr:TonB-dependent receptor [Chitinispirillaceae bacterium]
MISRTTPLLGRFLRESIFIVIGAFAVYSEPVQSPAVEIIHDTSEITENEDSTFTSEVHTDSNKTFEQSITGHPVDTGKNDRVSATTAAEEPTTADSIPDIIIEGVLIDQQTGNSPDDSTLRLFIDRHPVPVTSGGEFSYSTGRKILYLITATSAVYKPIKQTVTSTAGKNNYFATLLLDTVSAGETDSLPAKADTSHLPWTISGTIIDSRFDLAIESDSITLLFDGDTATATENGNFIITTRISGLHTLWVSIPGYQEVSQTIVLTEEEKQPFITIPTTITGRTITRRELTVTASSLPVHRTASVARTDISRKELVQSTATLNDPVRALQTLPGVTAESDIAARPVIRGGDVLESRATLDGVSLIQPYHFGGVRSTYNQFALKGLTLYKSGFPAEFHNAQSGIIDATTRIPSDEKISFDAEVNNMQYAAYIGVPLFKGKAGLNGSVQGSYMNAMTKLEMRLLSKIENDPSIEQMSSLFNLPDYQDFSVGLSITPTPSLKILINEVHNTDRCSFSSGDSVYDITYHYSDTTVIVQQSFWMTRDTSIDRFMEPLPGRTHDGHPDISKPYFDIDTIMDYRSRYNILYGTAQYNPAPAHLITLSAAWQKRWWDLFFPEIDTAISRSVYDVGINEYNCNVGWMYSGLTGHTLKAGAQIDYTHTVYDVDILRYLHEMITSGSTNLTDFWGPANGDTARVLNSSDSEFLYDFMTRFFIRYRGNRRYYNAGGYLHDSWDISPRLHCDIGARVEYSSTDHVTTLSPRSAVRFNLTEKNELIGSIGLYTQNNYDIAAIALSDNLKPEKVWHGSIGMESKFLPWLTQKIDFYGKYYYDLLSEVFSPVDTIYDVFDLSNDTFLNDETPDSLQSELTPDFFYRHATYRSRYVNDGSGYAFGAEYLLRFNPADFWHGWISVSAGRSIRQRREGWRKHPFPLDRPVLISLQNFYRLPKKFEIGLKYRYISGLPYTSAQIQGDSIIIGAFNDRRYQAYHRLDIRFSKGFSIRDAKGHFYIELWNAMNAPNVFALDSKSRKIISYLPNLPTTYPFLGIDLSF